MKTPREKWVLALLPAVLALGVYFWTSGRQSSASLKTAQAELAKASETDSRSRAKALVTEAQRLQDELELERSRVAQAPHQAEAPLEIDRTRTLRALTGIFARHGLQLRSTHRLTSTPVSKESETLALDLCARASASAPQFWMLEFTGPYAETLQAIRDMTHSRDLVVPTGIIMKSDDIESAEHHWSLTVWM